MTAVQFRNPEVRLSEALTNTLHAIEGHRVTLRELLALWGAEQFGEQATKGFINEGKTVWTRQ